MRRAGARRVADVRAENSPASTISAAPGHRYAPAMTDDLTLVDLAGDDLATYLVHLEKSYADDMHRLGGVPIDEAREKSRRSMAELFPDGQPAEGNQLWRAQDADGADGRHPLAGPTRRRCRRPVRLDLRHRGGGVPARAGLGSSADAGRRADQPRVGADLVAAQRLRRQRRGPQPVPQPGLPRAGRRRWRRISERVGVRHDGGRAGGRAGGPEPVAWFGGRLAHDLVDVVRSASADDAPAVLDHVERSGGWWAVVADYEGAVVAARFADVSRTEPVGRPALARTGRRRLVVVAVRGRVRRGLPRGAVADRPRRGLPGQRLPGAGAGAARGRRRGRAGPAAA